MRNWRIEWGMDWDKEMQDWVVAGMETLEAPTKQAAEALMVERGLTVVSVEELGALPLR